MKVKEFKKEIIDIGAKYNLDLEVTEDIFDFYIKSGTRPLASVSKSTTYLVIAGYAMYEKLEERLRRDLLNAMYELASTPLAERKEEKRYIIPLPHLTSSDGEQLFLTHQGNFFPCERNMGLRQTWKEKDLTHIPEEYRGFAVEIVEVEEWKLKI